MSLKEGLPTMVYTGVRYARGGRSLEPADQFRDGPIRMFIPTNVFSSEDGPHKNKSSSF